MNKKEFKQATTKIYKEYGFIKKGKYYYLDLDYVIICSGIFNVHGVTFLAYNVRIKEIHLDDELKVNDIFDGFDCILVSMYYNSEDGYDDPEVYFDKYSIKDYEEKLRKILPKYFDPYKKDAFDYMRKAYLTKGLIKKNNIIMLKGKAREFLNLD